MGILTPELRARVMKLSTTNFSDAMESLGFNGAALGIGPLWDACPKAVGEAVTMKLIPSDHTHKTTHMGIPMIEAADPGSIIVVDDYGRMDMNTCGGLMATACTMRGIAGWVSDGVVRDVDEIMELNFPVYCKGRIVPTNRGKLMEAYTNQPVNCGGALVCPGDVMVCDQSGVVCIPQDKFFEVLEKAEQIEQREKEMIKQLQAGEAFSKVDRQADYENMLKK